VVFSEQSACIPFERRIKHGMKPFFAPAQTVLVTRVVFTVRLRGFPQLRSKRTEFSLL
jgi:hypothetical protein